MFMMWWIVASLLVATPLQAQERSVPERLAEAQLPREVEAELLELYGRETTLRLQQSTRIAAEEVVHGDVLASGGDLVVAGRVEGAVVVLGADVVLEPGASIGGGVTVVGGEVRGLPHATVRGEVRTYAAYPRDAWWRVGDAAEEEPSRKRGSAKFLIATGQSYNRVEGLPITLGPVIDTGGDDPLRVRALAIYRTESGLTLDTDRLGYYIRAEQLWDRGRLRLGATMHSRIDPIEEWHVTDLENGLSTFLLHRDFRDHYEREGWSLFAGYRPSHSPLRLQVEGLWEEHRSVAAGSPWALFRNAEAWRAQPLVGSGRLGSVVLSTTYDTRSDPADPATGWYVRTRLERAFVADLERREIVAEESVTVPEEYGPFTTTWLDVRRYNRVGPQSRLGFRFLVGGSPDGSILPPQRQHALGGEGSLPGYSLFRFDCGARRAPIAPGPGAVGAGFYPRYGCDAFALLQAEYRGKLDLRLEWAGGPWEDDPSEGDVGGWEFGWIPSPDWVVFLDAGRGWAPERGASDPLALDIGMGVLFHKIGLYLAVPLRSGGEVNVFARLGPRF